MKCYCLVIAMLILSIFSISHAEMYIWVDENGVRHFTDSPPTADEVSPDQVKQSETVGYVFKHPLFHETEKHKYCGNEQLPHLIKEDYGRYLSDVQRTYRKAGERQRELLDDLTKADSNSRLPKAQSDYYKKTLRESLNEVECILGWSADVIEKLENAKAKSK